MRGFYGHEQALNCTPRHVLRILVAVRGSEQSNFKDGTVWSLGLLYLEPRPPSGGVVDAGLG